MNDVDLSDPLKYLCGLSLSSVTFVMDYIQLEFGGPVLTAWTHPRVEQDAAIKTWGDPGYCDALRRLIGTKVVDTSVQEEVEIRIQFSDGNRVIVSLRDEDYTEWGEAAMIQSKHPPFWMVW